jgi:hypothetical protein
MSTLGGIRIIWAGQSNAVATTNTRAVTDAKYSPLTNVPAWVWFRAAASSLDPRVKRTVWSPYQAAKSYPITFSPLTDSRDWPGAELVCAWKLLDMGHSPHVIQVAEGGSSLGQDWHPVDGFKRDFEKLKWEWTEALASRLCPADPGANRTVLVWIQGEEDAGSGPLSAAYQSNWDLMIAALRTHVGIPALRVVMLKLNTHCAAANTAAVRTGMVNIVGADANVHLVDVDDLLLHDGFHYTAVNAEIVGLRLAAAIDAVMP